MRKLYRIVSFPEFINLIECREVRFVKPVMWEDTYEGYMLRLLDDSKKRKDILRLLYEKVTPNRIDKTISNYMKLWSAKWLCYGQSWSKTSESDKLWTTYSYGNMAIRIETTEEIIQSQFVKSGLGEEYSLQMENVEYDLDKEDMLTEQVELLRKNRNVIEPYLHKIKKFDFENEKRVLLFCKSKSVFCGLSASGALFNYNKYANNEKISNDNMLEIMEKEILKMQYPYEDEKLETEIYMKIEDLSKYIKSVMLHPKAEDWIEKLVRTICCRQKLNYVGKSCMYDK